MNTQKPEVKLAFDRTSTDKVSLKIRVIFRRDSRRYAFPIKSGVFLAEKDFERLVRYHEKRHAGVSETVREIYGRIEPHLQKARKVAEGLSPFTFEAFKLGFYQEEQTVSDFDRTNLIKALQAKAAEMKRQNRVGNESMYDLAAKSLIRYLISMTDNQARMGLGLPLVPRGKRPEDVPELLRLTFQQLTASLLADYERWMLVHGKAPRKPGGMPGPASSTTVGIYLRHVRAVYSEAVANRIVAKEHYPFGRKKYVIPAGRNVKKALSQEDLDLLKTYQPEPGSFEQRSHDLWLFSYFSNGMNLTDVCRLRWQDLDMKVNTFRFVRTKSARTKKENQTPISGSLRSETLSIVSRWGNPDRRADSFVFPFLSDDMDSRKQRATVLQVTKVTNNWMKKIAKKLGIEANISTYYARHSFATALLRSEAPVGFISQKLGHASLKTTENYLGSFTDEQTRKYLDAL